MPPEPEGSGTRQEILITHAFRRNLKDLRRHLREDDVLRDIRRFVSSGLRRGEAELKAQAFGDVEIIILKLRLRVGNAAARYLLGVLGDREYLPLFIDLKTGVYGKNLSLKANKKVASKLQAAIQRALLDYIEHTETEPRLVRYPVEAPAEEA